MEVNGFSGNCGTWNKTAYGLLYRQKHLPRAYTIAANTDKEKF